MIRITIICLLVSFVNSDECTMNDQTIKDLQTSLITVGNAMKEIATNDTAVIFIGSTRAGKSTLLNYLIGNKLNARRINTFSLAIEKADKNEKGPVIGHGKVSNTSVPSNWTSPELPGMTLWDTPGFGDNRGDVKDITNAFYLFKLLEKVNSIKFTIIVSFDDIYEGGTSSFLGLLTNLESLFGEKFNDFFSSMSLIISKVPDEIDDNSCDINYFKNKLDIYVKSNIAINSASRNFLKYIVDHPEHIGLFRKINGLGLITPEQIDVNIIPAIKKSESIGHSELNGTIHPSISDRAKLCVIQYKDKILALNAIFEVENMVTNLFKEKFNNYKKYSNMGETNKSEAIQNYFLKTKDKIPMNIIDESPFNVKKVIESLQNIDDSVRRKIDQNGLSAKLDICMFLDYLLNKNFMDDLKVVLKTVVFKAISQVEETIMSINFKRRNVTLARYNNIIRILYKNHSNQVSKLEAEIEELKKSKQKKGDSFLQILEEAGKLLVSILHNLISFN